MQAQAPDRSDATAAGCSGALKAAQEDSETFEKRERDLLPQRSVQGWLDNTDMIPMAKEGADVSTWAHPQFACRK